MSVADNSTPAAPPLDWAQVMQNSLDLILIVDEQGLIIDANHTLPHRPRDQVIGTSALSYVDGDARGQLQSHIAHVFQTQNSMRYEISGAGPNGTTSWYLSSISPVLHDGRVVAATIITRDITERRQLEQSVLEAYELERAAGDRLRELDDLKGEFVAKVIHDLRTPITIIDGFAQTLVDGWDTFSDERKLEFVELMRSSAGRLRNLVRDVLDATRLESAQFTVDIEPIDVHDAINRAVTMMSALQRQIVCDIAPDLPLMLADAGRHEQVLLNLLSNAVKFSELDTPISISVRHVAPNVEVTVTDAGVGIAESDIPRLFTKFTQLPSVNLSTPEGSGLGLYICRALLEAQNGSIDVTSTLGVGSSFVYRLPAAT